MAEELKLIEFDATSIPCDTTVAILGKRNTGKSTLLEYLLYNNRDKFTCVIVISSTEHLNNFFKRFIPSCFIHESDTIDVDFLAQIIERQERVKKEAPNKVNVLIILDDMMQDAQALKHKIFIKFANNGRHYKMGIWICAQYWMQVPKLIRSQFEFVFALDEDIISNRESLHKEAFGCVSKDKFEELFAEATPRFGALVINRTIREKEYWKKIFWMRATRVEKTTPPEDPYNWRLTNTNMYAFAEKYQLQPDEYKSSKSMSFSTGGSSSAASSGRSGRSKSRSKITRCKLNGDVNVD